MATNLPPYWPRIPCENAFAVSSAELTNDLPSIITCSFTLPPMIFNFPEYRLELSLRTLISSAIDLEWITVILSAINFPSITSNEPEYSFTLESIDCTYFVSSLIWSGWI